MHPVVTLVVTSAGQVTTGGNKSCTDTVKLQLPLFPLLSLAVQVTVVTPTAKALPLGGVQLTFVTLQLSVALVV